jgi:hypothetical protein
MPWKEISMSGKRAEFVLLANKEDSNMSALCKRFEISRKAGYEWLKWHVCAMSAPSWRPAKRLCLGNA